MLQILYRFPVPLEAKPWKNCLFCGDQTANMKVCWWNRAERLADSASGWVVGGNWVNLHPWFVSMWKWCPVFTVRDLALLSSRWSRPASERAPPPPSPQSPDRPDFPLLLLISPSFPSYLSFPPGLLLLFSVFLSCLAASHFEHRFHWFPASRPSPLPCPLFLPPPSSFFPLWHLPASWLCPLLLCVVKSGINLSSWPLPPVISSGASGDIRNSHLAAWICCTSCGRGPEQHQPPRSPSPFFCLSFSAEALWTPASI